jgi:hypothetical protein
MKPWNDPPPGGHAEQTAARVQALIDAWAAAHPVEAERIGVAPGRVPGEEMRLLLHVLTHELALADRQREASMRRLDRAVGATLDPALSRPLPSCTVLQLTPAPATPAGCVVPRGSAVKPARGTTSLQGRETSIQYCLAQDVSFWPVRVTYAEVARAGKRYELRLRLESHGPSFDQLHGLDRLTVCLHGGFDLTFPLLEALATARSVTVKGSEGHPLRVEPRGLSRADALWPAEPRGLPSTLLLLAFSVLPERFLFVDFAGLGPARLRRGPALDLVAVLHGDWSALEGRVDAGHFRLHCAPATNVSRVNGVNVRLAPERFEHPVDPNWPFPYEKPAPDGRTAADGGAGQTGGSGHAVEVLDVLQVRGVGGRTEDELVPPWQARRHGYNAAPPRLFHVCTRDPAAGAVCVRLVNDGGTPVPPAEWPPALAVDVLAFHGDVAVGRAVAWTCGEHAARVLVGPTPALRPVAAGAELAGLPALGLSREAGEAHRQRVLALLALHLWAPAAPAQQRHADRSAWLGSLALGVHDFVIGDDSEVVREPGRDVWVPGRGCTVQVTPACFPGGSVFLLGQVLDQYFAEKSGHHGFTRLVLQAPARSWSWQPRLAGCRGELPAPEVTE